MKLLLFLVFIPLSVYSMSPYSPVSEYFSLNIACQNKIDHVRIATLVRTTPLCQLSNVAVTWQERISEPEIPVEIFLHLDAIANMHSFTFCIPK